MAAASASAGCGVARNERDVAAATDSDDARKPRRPFWISMLSSIMSPGLLLLLVDDDGDANKAVVVDHDDDTGANAEAEPTRMLTRTVQAVWNFIVFYLRISIPSERGISRTR